MKRMKILALCPHTDDGEIGCGATLHKYSREGHEVHYVAFCRASVPDSFPPDSIVEELYKGTAELGINPDKVKLYDYTVRKLGYSRQDILENMIELRDSIEPDIVFMPSKDDFHQDHNTVYREGLRAFKYSTIFGYEMPVNNRSFEARGFCRVAEEDVEAKIRAVNAYASQLHRQFTRPDIIRALLVTRGVQVGLDYAECFDVIRLVLP